MFKKFLVAAAVLGMGLVASAGPAAADVTPYPQPPVTVVVNVNINIVIVNNGFIFFGDGFEPGELISIIAELLGPSGLRNTPALAAMASAPFTLPDATADANGHFETSIVFPAAGIYRLTALGQTSGRTANSQVTVLPVGSTVPVAAGANNSGSGLAYTGSDSGLAYTGSSIAGPLTIGALALVTGLALLFFGTRMAIRRKHTSVN
jgi:hypothetical protein